MNNKIGNIYAEASEDYVKSVSRENILECPHFMALSGYLHNRHGIPKFCFKKSSSTELHYHYTDANGLIGIINSGRLWATDIRFLNDPSEGVFFPERLLQIMEKSQMHNNDLINKIISGIRTSMEHPRSSHSTFCISLSRKGDQLSQWRGYGDFGKGYSIGFNIEENTPDIQLAHHYEIVYGSDGLQGIADDLIDIFSLSSEKWGNILYDEWASTIHFLAKSFKDGAYLEENESRLVCIYDHDRKDILENERSLKFRSRNGEIIPFLETSLYLESKEREKSLPIKEIIVGPGVDFERSYVAINSILKLNNYTDVEIVKSKIPFRP